MPPFTESFWTEDYITGLNRLYSKLQQGITEDEELLTLARKRADAEEAHGLKLQSASRDTMKKDGFAKDDGASTRKAFDGMLQETEDSGKSHIRISQNLHTMVLKPFARWSSEHANRVTSSHSDVTTKVKAHERQFNDVKKLRNTYFNKCRLLEDYEEEHKFAFPAHEGVKSSGHDTPTKSRETAASTGVQEDGEEEPIELGDVYYTESQMKSLLATMLDEIPRKEVKIPILGIFQNVSNGEAIVRWIQENMQLQSLGEAERVGQDLISTGHLRYLGVGNTFANSSVLNFQWKDKSLIAAGKQADLEKGLLQKATAMPYVGEYVLTYVANDYPNETPLQKLTREAAQSNETYKRAVQKLDKLRTDLEASIFEHLKYMERCEYDRLRALKAVMMDMSAAISNVIPGMKSSMDNMLLYQETISPDGDLRYMLESYRTGPFAPKVVTYENYYNVADEQTFGVDLEMKARQDRKRVPNIVASFLGFMDEQYPLLKSDEERRQVWSRSVPLHLTHSLRGILNNGKPVQKESLMSFELSIVASTLRLYFLELPESLITSSVYDAIKVIYATYGSDENPENRVTSIQNVLHQLKVTNIATLDALMTHFTRFLELTSADDKYRTDLANILSPCLLRPRTGTPITQQDRHGQRLILDLLSHKEEIFSNLRKATVAGRPRTVTDEKERKSRYEERNRAIASAVKGNTTIGEKTAESPRSPVVLPIAAAREEHSTETDQLPSLTEYPQEPPPLQEGLSLIRGDLDDLGPAKKPSLTRGNAIPRTHVNSRHGRSESHSRILTGDTRASLPAEEHSLRNLSRLSLESPSDEVALPAANRGHYQGVELQDRELDLDD